MNPGESAKIVIENIERMQIRLVTLKRLIEDYIKKNESYVPTFEFLDYLGQAESIINYLISVAEFTNMIQNKKQLIQKSSFPKYEEINAYR